LKPILFFVDSVIFRLDQFQKFIRPAFLNNYLTERLIPPKMVESRT